MTSTRLQNSPQARDIAPEFTVAPTSGSDVSLSSSREISRAYGVLNEDRFYSSRAYFVIDKEGRVRWVYAESNDGERRESSEVLAGIKLLS